MHSFHHSRGRILFEVACALTISASCLAAWMDLGVPAFLPAAAVSALYALVHLFDMRGRKPAIAFAAPAVELDAESQGDLLAYADVPAQAPAAGANPPFVELVEDAAPVEEPAPAPAPQPRPKKRKSSKKAAPVPEAELPPEPVVEPQPIAAAQSVEQAEPVVEEPPAAEEPPATEEEPVETEAFEEPEEHAPVTPLFEPEPFVRQQRAVFGRKAS